jgi:HK97 family phage major capsid protein
MTTEIEKKLSDETAKIFTRFEEIKKENKDYTDALVKAESDKLADVITKNLEKLQKIDLLEKAINRQSDFLKNSETNQDDLETKAKIEEFFKNGGKKEICVLERKDLRTDSNPDGGYLVRPQFSTQIITKIFESSPVRQYADVETIGTNELVLDIDDNETGYEWVGEGSLGSDTTTPQIGQLSIKVHKIATKPRISNEALEDPIRNLESWLQGKVVEKFARAEATSFISGNGITRPKGILTYSAWTSAGVYEREKLEQIASGSSGAFTIDGLINIQNSLLEQFQSNAIWMMNRSSFGSILKLNSANSYHFLSLQPSSQKQGMIELSLLGKPVVYASDIPIPAGNALSAIYGDFRAGYKIVDRVGINILRDPYSVDGFVVYKTYKRVGGAVQNYQALKIQKLG